MTPSLPRSRPDQPDLLARGPWALAFLVYLILVVYGSLVPLEWRELTFADAVVRFQNIPYLELGAASRADWVANIVLYVPLAFFGCAALLGFRPPGIIGLFGVLLVLAVCIAIAFAVEFTQLFFAPRTVSQNDLIAESIGSVLGVLAWWFGRFHVVWMARAFVRGGRESVAAALLLLLLAYLLLSLFPYDFVVSTTELATRVEQSGERWLFGSCHGTLRCVAIGLGEVGAIAPLGLLLVVLYPRLRLTTLLLLGLGIGLALETLQVLLVSGSSRALSVLLRGVGMVAGGLLARLLLFRLEVGALARLVWTAVPLLMVPYALALAGLSNWFNGHWLSSAQAFARLPTLGWVPFYYHYWTSEPEAMASLLAQLALYLPLGLALAARAVGYPGRRSAAWPVALLAVLAALVIETGKLFFTGARPDPSNLFIAPVGALLGYWGATWFGRVLRAGPAPAPVPAVASRASMSAPVADRRAPTLPFGTRVVVGNGPSAPPVTGWPGGAGDDGHAAAGGDGAPRSDRTAFAGARPLLPNASLPRPSQLGWLPATLFAAVALVGIGLYPVGLPWLVLALALYGAALWWRPALLLLALPIALPVLDLSPLSGRLLLSEFDLMVLVTLAVAGPRLSGVRPARWPNTLLPVALGLLWVTWVIATWRGLGGLGGLERLPMAASHTGLEAWFVGKGLLWALLLVPLWRRLRRYLGSGTTTGLVLDGTVIGLAMTTLVVLWERHIHVGLFDFEDVFRVTGPFASMHTGGAYIEAYLAFAFPLLLIWIVRRHRVWAGLTGAALVLLSGYAMFVTFSRAGYGALVVVSLVIVLGLVLGRRGGGHEPAGHDRGRWLRWALPVGAMLVLTALAVPALTSGFAQQRLSQVPGDLAFRLKHWSGALALMDADAPSLLFGEGFGRYPTLYLMAGRGKPPPGTFLVLDDDGERLLRLGHGEPLYFEQLVATRPDTTYRLSARLRSVDHPESKLSVPLCQKALLYSFTCVWTTLTARNTDGDWTAVSANVATGAVGRGGNWPRGPVKLSLYNSGRGLLDVADVRLIAPDGRDLVANGGFERRGDRWLFATDQDLAWHVHQQWVELFLAQGLMGVLAILLLLLAVAQVLWAAIRAGRLDGLAFAAGLAGLLAVGLLGSTMDNARPMLLFYLAAFSAALLVRGAPVPSRRRHRSAPAAGTTSVRGDLRTTGRSSSNYETREKRENHDR